MQHTVFLRTDLVNGYNFLNLQNLVNSTNVDLQYSELLQNGHLKTHVGNNFLRRDTMCPGRSLPAFQRNILPAFSGSKGTQSSKHTLRARRWSSKFLRKSVNLYLNIMFQHPIAVVNDLICRGSLEGVISLRARRLLVCSFITFLGP